MNLTVLCSVHGNRYTFVRERTVVTLIVLKWRIWRDRNNASKWQMGFNSAFKGLIKQKTLNGTVQCQSLGRPGLRIWTPLHPLKNVRTKFRDYRSADV